MLREAEVAYIKHIVRPFCPFPVLMEKGDRICQNHVLTVNVKEAHRVIRNLLTD